MRDKRILMLYRESCIFKPHARRASFPGIAHGSHIFFFVIFYFFLFLFLFLREMAGGKLLVASGELVEMVAPRGRYIHIRLPPPIVHTSQCKQEISYLHQCDAGHRVSYPIDPDYNRGAHSMCFPVWTSPHKNSQRSDEAFTHPQQPVYATKC